MQFSALLNKLESSVFTQNGDHSLKIVQACTANDPCVHTELFSHVILI